MRNLFTKFLDAKWRGKTVGDRVFTFTVVLMAPLLSGAAEFWKHGWSWGAQVRFTIAGVGAFLLLTLIGYLLFRFKQGALQVDFIVKQKRHRLQSRSR